MTGADEAFVRQFRTGRNVLGVAVQLCTLPWLGFVPDEVALAPDAVVGRLSQRLGIAMGELRGLRRAGADPYGSSAGGGKRAEQVFSDLWMLP